jgi:hypothetical protein
MELVLLFVLSIIVAILFNWGQPRFMATSLGGRFGGNFAGQTLMTAIVFFAAIWVASVALSAVDKSPRLP